MKVTTQEVPAWVEEKLLRLGGSTLEGKPRYRVVWGGSRLIPGPDGITLVHAYQIDRWHLEKLLNGEYEYSYTLAHCPHMKKGQASWCNKCFLSGGEFIGLSDGMPVIERAIQLVEMSVKLQDKTLQKNALMERENKKIEEGQQNIDDAFKQAAPKSIKRSFDTPLRITADRALGNHRGMRQMSTREIVKNLRRKHNGNSASGTAR